jgi:oxalate decarboxylase
MAAASIVPALAATQRSARQIDPEHTAPNVKELGPQNAVSEQSNSNSVFPPEADAGGQPPFKYPFAFAHRRVESGGWTRQVTVRDLPVSKKMAGVEMRLIRGGIRELHWHVGSEWAYMVAGTARITGVDQKGRAFVEDVREGDV